MQGDVDVLVICRSQRPPIMKAMVEVMSPTGSQHLACSEACRPGAIANGPSPVLLPPDGPRDLPPVGDLAAQLELDAETLHRFRSEHGLNPGGPDWAGASLHAIAGRAAVIARQLAPVRTRRTLLESYRREAGHSAAVRLGYAMAWLALGPGDGWAGIARRRARRTSVRRG